MNHDCPVKRQAGVLSNDAADKLAATTITLHGVVEPERLGSQTEAMPLVGCLKTLDTPRKSEAAHPLSVGEEAETS